jgi:Ca2+-binding EF-hand superfamily protein
MDILILKYGKNGAFKDIDDLIQKIDFDGSGTVDIKEFIAATINLKDASDENFLKQAFKLFDLVMNTFSQ